MLILSYMRKSKLVTDFNIDFELFGLVCNKKEYKLAWYLNQGFGFNLVKQDNIKIEFSDHTSILISNCKFQTEHMSFELLQNKLPASANPKYKLLIPELSQFDYLIKFKDSSGEITSENVTVIIKEIPIVEYVMRLTFDSLKSKENLLY